MEFVLASANYEAVKEYDERIGLAGVATNPTVIANSKQAFPQGIRKIIDYLDDEQTLFVQVLATDEDGIMKEARKIHALRKKNIYVKIPADATGMKAIHRCKKEGIPVLATAVCSAEQGFLAALAGADYVAPYVGRMECCCDGIKETITLIQMLRIQHMSTKVMGASIKHARQFNELIAAGIDAITIPPDMIAKMLEHSVTSASVKGFIKDWDDAYHRTDLF